MIYFIDSLSTEALILVGGAMLGLGAAVWAYFEVGKRKPRIGNSLRVLVISLIVIFLARASIWKPDFSYFLESRVHARWSGPWDNPNIFGVFMGTGVALALGLLVQSLKFNAQSQKTQIGIKRWRLGIWKYSVTVLCLLAAILIGRGLMHSYSRGAWLATLCGLAYLFFRVIKDPHFQQIRAGSWINTNKISLVVIICAITILIIWQFQQPQNPIAKRAFSVANINDFSWRNRITAWEGALQITAEHPCLGTGWNQPKSLYEHYYMPPNLSESAAITLNDYLMLGATIGIPALFCFGMYIWLTLGQNPESRIRNPDLLQTTCHAGAIVLLVGFWFDGGLFKLPTAATFWILLELGAVKLPQNGTSGAKSEPAPSL